MATCAHFTVSGHVQGVFFRATAREKALSLGLSGWAKNLPDGRVEVVVSGPADQVAKLEAWLREGPRQAEVAQVVRETVDLPVPSVGFYIG